MRLFSLVCRENKERRKRLYPKLRDDRDLWVLLLKIEKNLAEQHREKGCACGGKLHRARYRRKPRGGPEWLGEEYEWRESFCCERKGCRRRATPPSVLYFGRRVYYGLVMILVSALRQGPTAQSGEKIRRWLGVDLRTIRRWQRWWREVFPGLAFWRGLRGSAWAMLPVEELPLALWESIQGEDLLQRTQRLMCFFLPLTGHGN